MAAQSRVSSRPPSVARRRSQMYVDIPLVARPDTPSTSVSVAISRPHTPRSQMYVDMPPLSRGGPSSTRRPSTNGQMHGPSRHDGPSGSSTASSLKENTPLRPSRTNSSSTSLTSLSSLSSGNNPLPVPTKDGSRNDKSKEHVNTSSPATATNGSTTTKRKLGADEDTPDTSTQAVSIADKVKMKRPRLSRRDSVVEVVVPVIDGKPRKSSTAGKSKAKNDDAKPPTKKIDEKGRVEDSDDAILYPNGWFYCHQCEKKRGNEIRLQCTLKDAKNRNERCRAKYCKPCLRNRYGQDFDELRAHNGDDMPISEKTKHYNGEEYYFECFKCKDTCNCKKCRRRHGLDPTGRLESKDDKKRVAEGKPNASKPKRKSAKPKATKDGISQLAEFSSAPQEPAPVAKRNPRAKPAAKPKPIPRPTWSRLEVPLNLPDLEARILIREFVHRFDGILQLSISNVEELEELVGETLGGDEWDDNDQELVGWASEACVKAIVMGLLEVISGRTTALGYAEISQTIKEAIKTIRGSGANLNRIWVALSSLRESARRCNGGWGKALLKFPDPLPPPALTTFRSTRSVAAVESSVNVVCSAQMIPVVAFLVNQAIDSPAVREAIDLGITDVKDIAQGAKESIAKENARYKEEKEGHVKDKGEVKAARDLHLQTIQDLELGQKLVSSSYAPRFSPLGRDAEGRVYYALTPSASECEAAEKLVTGKGTGKVKLRGHRGGYGERERREMRRWSWFVCVHGEKPADALKAKELKEEEDGSESELTDQEEDVWWGFWDPEEIRKLAGWLATKHGLDAEDDDKEAEDIPLVRTQVNSRALPSSTGPSGARKPKQVEPASNGVAKGRPSNLTISSSRSSAKGKLRDISPLSDLSSSNNVSSSSELSGVDSDSDVDMEGDFAQYLRPTPGKAELRMLVKALTEYAEMLQWRLTRVAPGDAQVASNIVIAESSKGKEKEVSDS